MIKVLADIGVGDGSGAEQGGTAFQVLLVVPLQSKKHYREADTASWIRTVDIVVAVTPTL